MDHLPMPKFGPLAGLRVVFSGIEIAGPFAGQMFRRMGGGSYLDRGTSPGPTPFAFNRTTRSSPAAICMRCR
ncbi:crotonobetainyl-CoA:carnitine CoA-transferase [Escherichia coli]|uniref:Crotonobetainyl-CoA:carnitine CoA-transferase n=1 Tax=Escherichia coli TaxID=562 RepID=A0A376VYW6_ECOLX|nr:crotonobetainyl-CoA:carnitine CoA-transferase [Escherichia coli]